MKCFFGHKWGKWGEPIDIEKTTYIYGQIYRQQAKGQRRRCDRCGKILLMPIGGKS